MFFNDNKRISTTTAINTPHSYMSTNTHTHVYVRAIHIAFEPSATCCAFVVVRSRSFNNMLLHCNYTMKLTR